jgi:hypothetical protein
MKINWKNTLAAAGVIGLAAVPFIAKADGFNFNVAVGDDNEAHYHFQDQTIRHNPEMWKAAQSLAHAKIHLWNSRGDFGGHRANAVQDINLALDEISLAENNWRDGR